MDILTAVGEPTRRSIVELLASGGPMSATEISSKFKASAPAISQHLKVLREAEVVTMEKQAQQRIYQINPVAFHQLEAWARRMAERYEERYAALDELLEREKARSTEEKGGK